MKQIGSLRNLVGLDPNAPSEPQDQKAAYEVDQPAQEQTAAGVPWKFVRKRFDQTMGPVIEAETLPGMRPGEAE